MRGAVIIAVLSLMLIAGIFIWRNSGVADPVRLSAAQAEPIGEGENAARIFLKIEGTSAPDILIGVSSPAAQQAEIVAPDGRASIAIPADSTPSLSGDGVYLLLSGIEGVLSEGRLIPLALNFERSGELTIRARVGAEADPHAKHRAMAEMTQEASSGPAPSLSMSLEQAANGATLVRLETENFTFDPGSETPEHVPGHGHGHLYLDGLKLQRMYTREALIGALPPGHYTVRAELNSNTHMAYRNADGPIAAEKILVVE